MNFNLVKLVSHSLVGRVFALYIATLLTFVLTGVAIFYLYQFTGELSDAQQRTDALSQVMTPTVIDSAVIGDYDTIRRTLERAVHQSTLASASYIDLQGGVIKAVFETDAQVGPPQWLLRLVSARLFDVNQNISVGGRDYGVLRLSFANERIAARLWEQLLVALLLALVSIAGGSLLIWFPLERWLGNLSLVRDFEQAMLRGESGQLFSVPEKLPLEFRRTFEVLKRAAVNLQSQRIEAEVTLGAITDGVFTLDPQGQVVLVNPAGCLMTGKSHHELIGQPIAAIFPQLFIGGQTLRSWMARRVTLAVGEKRRLVVNTNLSTIDTPDGRVAGFVLACNDISEQYELNQRLRNELKARESTLVALRKVLEGLLLSTSTSHLAADSDDLQAISAMISELVAQLQIRGEQLNGIFALSPDGFVSFDAQRRANYVSPAFERLTGIPDTMVLGRQALEVEALIRIQCNPEMPWRSVIAAREDAGASTLDLQPQRERIELLRPVHRVIEVGLVEGSSDAISQVLSLRDVTHESEIDNMKSEFLSTAAHELRTPMTSIYGFVQLLVNRKLTPERQLEIYNTIYRQTERMISILNELLDLSRIEARRGKDFVFEVTDLLALVQDILRDFKPPQERAQPLVQKEDSPVLVVVDRNKMVQAVGNILSNAYKYSPGGGDVQVRLVRDRGSEPMMVGIEVRDHGMGLTADQLARVSERFYRADASGTIPGTGLGMSIVKEIIELHGGELRLESERHVGTAVTLWLPSAPPALTQAARLRA